MSEKEKIKQKKSSEKTANKIFGLWEILDGFGDEDIENLKKVKVALQEQSSKLNAVAGILVNLEKADYQTELNELRVKRINALITLLENRGKDWEIGAEYLKKKKDQEGIDKIFGL